ncbi:MAG: helix-turn-helix domain-containing protein, partial [Actinomycetota bacterium]|nr:helix-turn-helix domain-containing protein [Actinomycetota bacterium]
MTVVAAYRQARHDEEIARLRRVLALRAMVASGMSQREIADELGVSQPAVSQQLKVANGLARIHPETLI